MKNTFIIIVFYFLFSFPLKAQDVVIVRDIVDSPVVNNIINNIVSSIEEFVPNDLSVYTEREKMYYNDSNRTIAIGDKSIAIINSKNPTSNDNFYIGNMSPSDNAYSFAFTPSPESVIQSIKKNFPDKKQLYIVSNKRHEWLDKQYAYYCKKNNIKLNLYYGSSLRVAIEHYKNILSSMDSEDSILLINENSLIDDDAILPYILNKSWDDDVVVVSTKASHAKYGILMSLVPDIENFGKQINDCLKEECNKIYNIDGFNVGKPLVNKRMYKHLELNFENDVLFLE